MDLQRSEGNVSLHGSRECRSASGVRVMA